MAVYGVPSARYGEEVAAAVKLRPEAKTDAEDLRRFCEGNISKFKIPRYIQFVESYPLTASGKIQKFILRQSAAADFGLENVS